MDFTIPREIEDYYAELVAFMLGASFGVLHSVPFLYLYLALAWLIAANFLGAGRALATDNPIGPRRRLGHR